MRPLVTVQHADRYWNASLIFMLLVSVVQAIFVLVADNRTVWQGQLELPAGQQASQQQTVPLRLKGGNLEIQQSAQLSNQWVYSSFTLIHVQSGMEFEAHKELSAYHGVEGGTAWHEDDSKGSLLIAGLEPGDYVLNLEVQADASHQGIRLATSLVEDVPIWSNFWLMLLALLAIPWAYWGWLRRRDRYNRYF